jgi:hypothetical protein
MLPWKQALLGWSRPLPPARLVRLCGGTWVRQALSGLSPLVCLFRYMMKCMVLPRDCRPWQMGGYEGEAMKNRPVQEQDPHALETPNIHNKTTIYGVPTGFSHSL